MNPDGPKSPPPEEKLLKLIRGAKAAPAPAGAAPAPAAAKPRAGGALQRLFRLPSWWLTAINIGLLSLIVGEALVLGVAMTRPAPVALPPAAAPAKNAVAAAVTPEGQTGPDSSLAAAASRPLFRAGQGARAQVPAPVSSQAKALASRLNLIGIVPGDPSQAIIEDAQTKKTYFVTVGQHVLEGLVVHEILEKRIVLRLNGEYLELSL